MVNEIREAAGDTRPAFIEAWVLNWDWRMDMLKEVERRLGSDFVCVRPDVLVQLRQKQAK
jgi:putative glycoside hydrolase with GxGYxYP motif